MIDTNKYFADYLLNYILKQNKKLENIKKVCSCTPAIDSEKLADEIEKIIESEE